MQPFRESIERHGLWYALGFFLFTRAVVMTVALTAPQNRGPRPDPPDWWLHIPTIRWDAGHYLEIIMEGYPAEIDDTVAFFPAYPLLCRPVQSLFGLFVEDRCFAAELALVTVANLSALAAVPFLYAWGRRRRGSAAALVCVMLLSVYPPALFFSAGYADALLVLCTAAILWLLDRGQIWPAAWVCALATATRPTGLPVAAIVALWAWCDGKTAAIGRRMLRAGLVAAVAVSGFVAFQLHLWHHYGRPDAFKAVQSNWGAASPVTNRLERILTLKPVTQPALRPLKYGIRGLAAAVAYPFSGFNSEWRAAARDQLGRLLEPDTWHQFFNLAILVLAVVGLIRPGNIPRMLFLIPILVFLMGYAADPYRGYRLVGVARYHLVALPCFLLLAGRLERSRFVLGALAAGLFLLQCVYVRLFADWILVG